MNIITNKTSVVRHYNSGYAMNSYCLGLMIMKINILAEGEMF